MTVSYVFWVGVGGGEAKSQGFNRTPVKN